MIYTSTTKLEQRGIDHKAAENNATGSSKVTTNTTK